MELTQDLINAVDLAICEAEEESNLTLSLVETDVREVGSRKVTYYRALVPAEHDRERFCLALIQGLMRGEVLELPEQVRFSLRKEKPDCPVPSSSRLSSFRHWRRYVTPALTIILEAGILAGSSLIEKHKRKRSVDPESGE